MKRFYLLIIATLLTFFSCSDQLKPVEYMTWIEDQDNGLKISQSTSDASYILQYEPPAYKALKSLGPSKATRSRLKGEQEKYQEMHHFLLKIKPKKESRRDSDVPKYLAYSLKDELEFIRGKDTLRRTVMYHLESSSGVRPYYRILLAYPRNSANENLELIINSNRIDDQSVHFAIPGSVLSDIPEVQTEKMRK